MLQDSLFYAKILLFGEYGIIEDSMGLSIPFHFYKGQFSFSSLDEPKQQASNQSLKGFLHYLRNLELEGQLPCRMDLAQLEHDIDRGLTFESSIPQGFGVGSSGALVAAVYDKYSLDKATTQETPNGDDLLQLKNTLAILESYFHGKSSGLDPLICYLNLPILISSKSELGTVGIPSENAEGKGAIFLLNSGNPGKTQGMVSIFLDKLKQDGFRNLVRNQLKKYNDECIKSFLNGDVKPLFSNLKELSKLFLENFKPMIPQHFEQLWKQGIESNAYYLKLCGSGGGGFILGFTQDIDQARELLKEQKIEVIYKF